MYNVVVVNVLNHLLEGAEWARTRLHTHQGQSVVIELGPLVLTLRVTATGHFEYPRGSTPTADVTITLPPSAPMLALQDVDRVLQQARISGNAEFAEVLSFVFRNLEWDVEADLARVVGDVFAHRFVLLGKALQQRLKQASGNLAANLTEYARDEAQVLVAPGDMQSLTQSITVLRDDLARLEKRIQSLGAAN